MILNWWSPKNDHLTVIARVSSTYCSWDSATAWASHWKGVSLAIGCQWRWNSSWSTHWSSQIFEVRYCDGIRASDHKGVHVNSKLKKLCQQVLSVKWKFGLVSWGIRLLHLANIGVIFADSNPATSSRRRRRRLKVGQVLSNFTSTSQSN